MVIILTTVLINIIIVVTHNMGINAVDAFRSSAERFYFSASKDDASPSPSPFGRTPIFTRRLFLKLD